MMVPLLICRWRSWKNGTRENFRALRTLLTDLGDMVAREEVRSPALLVVGEVARYGDADNKFIEYAEAAGVLV